MSSGALPASMRGATLPRRSAPYTATSLPCDRHLTAPGRAARVRLCRHARGLGASEADVKNLQPRLQRRRDGALPLPGAVASAAAEGCGDGTRAGGRRPRFLCLHGFRTSGEIMRRQVVGRWPAEMTSRLDLVFPDAPFPAEGASPVAGVFDPPYYEWCQFAGEDFLKCRNLDRCFSYVEELMAREWPFDGLLGFSQGAGVSAVLAGLQEPGLALTRVAKVKYVMVIAGAKIRSPAAATRAFASKIKCPSLHFIRDDDFVKIHNEELVEAFVGPLVIRHPCGHTVPRLDDKGLQVIIS